jgi:hypothetical protein
VIFLTPRVLQTNEDVADESRNRKSYLDTGGVWDPGWSRSKLADPISASEQKKILKRGEKTIVPPEYPLTSLLAPLNEKYGLTNAVPPAYNPTPVVVTEGADFERPASRAPAPAPIEEEIEEESEAENVSSEPAAPMPEMAEQSNVSSAIPVVPSAQIPAQPAAVETSVDNSLREIFGE